MAIAVLVGSLTLPAGTRDRWFQEALTVADLEGWSEEGELFDGTAEPNYATVSALVDAMAIRADEPGPTFLELDGIETISIRGTFDEDTFVQLHQDVTVALRKAQALGGRGEAAFLLLGTSGAFHIELNDEGSFLSLEEASELFHESEGIAQSFVELSEWIHALGRTESLSRAAYLQLEARLGLPPEPLEQEQSTRQYIDALSDDALTAALTAEREASDSALVVNAEAYRLALASHAPAARVLSPVLAARAGATQLQADWLRWLELAESRHAKCSLLRALAQTPSEPVIDALLRAASEAGAVGAEATTQLAQLQVPTLSNDLEQRLDSALFQTGTYAAVAPGRDPSESEAASASASLACAVGVLTALQARKVRTAFPKLVALFRSTCPEHLLLKTTVVAALVALGTPDQLKELEDELAYFQVGMGHALNANVERRASLLGLTRADEDFAKFTGVTADTLRALLEEQFIDANARQNDAPSTEEFLVFLSEWPEATAYGYAVGPARKDYRVMLEGLLVETAPADSDRGESLREAFIDFCAGATELDIEPPLLRAFWT